MCPSRKDRRGGGERGSGSGSTSRRLRDREGEEERGMKTREEGEREREREKETEDRTQRDGGEKGGPGGMARESRGGRHLKGRVGWRVALLSRERSAEQMQSGNPGPGARFRDRGPSTWRSRHRLKVSTAETAKGGEGRGWRVGTG